MGAGAAKGLRSEKLQQVNLIVSAIIYDTTKDSNLLLLESISNKNSSATSDSISKKQNHTQVTQKIIQSIPTTSLSFRQYLFKLSERVSNTKYCIKSSLSSLTESDFDTLRTYILAHSRTLFSIERYEEILNKKIRKINDDEIDDEIDEDEKNRKENNDEILPFYNNSLSDSEDSTLISSVLTPRHDSSSASTTHPSSSISSTHPSSHTSISTHPSQTSSHPRTINESDSENESDSTNDLKMKFYMNLSSPRFEENEIIEDLENLDEEDDDDKRNRREDENENELDALIFPSDMVSEKIKEKKKEEGKLIIQDKKNEKVKENDTKESKIAKALAKLWQIEDDTSLYSSYNVLDSSSKNSREYLPRIHKIEEENNKMIGLQRQKVLTLTENAKLEKEVEDLKRQLERLEQKWPEQPNATTSIPTSFSTASSNTSSIIRNGGSNIISSSTHQTSYLTNPGISNRNYKKRENEISSNSTISNPIRFSSKKLSLNISNNNDKKFNSNNSSPRYVSPSSITSHHNKQLQISSDADLSEDSSYSDIDSGRKRITNSARKKILLKSQTQISNRSGAVGRDEHEKKTSLINKLLVTSSYNPSFENREKDRDGGSNSTPSAAISSSSILKGLKNHDPSSSSQDEESISPPQHHNLSPRYTSNLSTKKIFKQQKQALNRINYKQRRHSLDEFSPSSDPIPNPSINKKKSIEDEEELLQDSLTETENDLVLMKKKIKNKLKLEDKSDKSESDGENKRSGRRSGRRSVLRNYENQEEKKDNDDDLHIEKERREKEKDDDDDEREDEGSVKGSARNYNSRIKSVSKDIDHILSDDSSSYEDFNKKLSRIKFKNSLQIKKNKILLESSNTPSTSTPNKFNPSLSIHESDSESTKNQSSRHFDSGYSSLDKEKDNYTSNDEDNSFSNKIKKRSFILKNASKNNKFHQKKNSTSSSSTVATNTTTEGNISDHSVSSFNSKSIKDRRTEKKRELEDEESDDILEKNKNKYKEENKEEQKDDRDSDLVSILQSYIEVEFLLRNSIKSQEIYQQLKVNIENSIQFIHSLGLLSKEYHISVGNLIHWILPHNATTKINNIQSSTYQRVIENLPQELENKNISDDKIKELVQSMNLLCNLIRIKIADENDLEQAKQSLLIIKSFFDDLETLSIKKDKSEIQIINILKQY